jgi:hypothetical protein
VAKIALSDHYLIYTCIDVNVKSREHKTVCFRYFKGFNAEHFISDLAQSEVLNNASSDEMNIENIWLKWKHDYLSICNKHAPFKEVRVKDRHNPWITSEIIKLMYKRDYIGEKAKIENDTDLLNEYKSLRNKVTYKIEQSKSDYLNNVTHKYSNNPKGLWKEIHKISGNDKHINNVHPNLNSNGFNNFFENVGTKISDSFNKDPLNWRNPKCIYKFVLESIPEENVLKHLLSQNESKLDVLNFDASYCK